MPKRARAASKSPERPATPTQEGRQNRQHYPTPTKAAVLGTIKYLEEHNVPYCKSNVFRTHGISNKQGCELLRENEHPNPAPRRHHNDPYLKERQGRHSKILKKTF